MPIQLFFYLQKKINQYIHLKISVDPLNFSKSSIQNRSFLSK